jgi:hypothetical protein
MIVYSASGIQRNLQRCAQTCLKDMSHLHIYFLMVGLREMNCSWADLTPDIRAGIVSYIERKFISIVEKVRYYVKSEMNCLSCCACDRTYLAWPTRLP